MLIRLPGPSATALAVTWVRAFYAALPAPLGIVADPVAATLMPKPLGGVARAAARSGRVGELVHRALAFGSQGMSTNVALRTAAIDDAIVGAVERGAAQLVVLGSGLDARAWRMEALREVSVYELDRGTNHTYKRTRVGPLAPKARRHRMVEIDFERETIPRALERAGFDTSKATVWLWEGVAVYLTADAVNATLDAVASCSAASSTLIATYTQPNLGQGLRRTVHWRVAARLIGEPVRGETTTESLHERLRRRQFEVVLDEGNEEAIRRYWGARWLSHASGWERIVVAVRQTAGDDFSCSACVEGKNLVQSGS